VHLTGHSSASPQKSSGQRALTAPACARCRSVAVRFDEFFGRRSVQLVLSRRATGPKPPDAQWWVNGPGSQWALLRSVFTQRGAAFDSQPADDVQRSHVVFDPLVATCDDELVLLPNVLACSQARRSHGSEQGALSLRL
jgi:hypothetical protein